MQHMQQPTCKKVRIRSTQDAHKIFYAVQKGLLQMVTRRLDADERQALHSGCIYAWEERGPHSEITGLGIERFTEGRRWSPSRVRDEFLFYYEKYSPPSDGSQVGTSSERHPPRDWDPLVKQTYSVWVETEKGRRKWHLTAYFTQQTIDQLGTIDDIPSVRDLIVPDGHFKSTRVGKNRSKSDEQNTRSGETSKPASTVTRTYAPFPSYPIYQPQTEAPPASQPVLMYEPYQNMHSHAGYHQANSQSPPSSSVLPSQSQTVLHSGPYYTQSDNYSQPMTSARPYPGPPRVETSATPASHLDPLQSPGQYQTPYYSSYTPSISPGHDTHPDTSGSMYHTGHGSHHSSPSQWSNSSSQEASDRNFVQSTPYTVPHNYGHAVVTMTSPEHLYSFTPPVPPNNQNLATGYQASSSQIQIHSPLPVDPNAVYSPLSPVRSPAQLQMLPDADQPNLPPLQIPEVVYSYEISPTDSNSAGSGSQRGSVGPCRDLAPLTSLQRSHPYKREPSDDKALRLLWPRAT